MGKPVLIMRGTTERPVGIVAGTLKLIGMNEEVSYKNFKLLLEDKAEYEKMKAKLGFFFIKIVVG